MKKYSITRMTLVCLILTMLAMLAVGMKWHKHGEAHGTLDVLAGSMVIVAVGAWCLRYISRLPIDQEQHKTEVLNRLGTLMEHDQISIQEADEAMWQAGYVHDGREWVFVGGKELSMYP